MGGTDKIYTPQGGYGKNYTPQGKEVYRVGSVKRPDSTIAYSQ